MQLVLALHSAGVVLAWLLFALLLVQAPTASCQSPPVQNLGQLQPTRIARENALAGSKDWWRPYLMGGTAADDAPQGKAEQHNASLDAEGLALEGFTTQFSVEPTEVLSVKVDYLHSAAAATSRATRAYTFSLHVYRLGFYAGLGARLVGTVPVSIDEKAAHVHERHTFLGHESKLWLHSQPECSFAEQTSTVDCSNWQPSASWTVPPEAVTGVYLAIPQATPQDANGTLATIRGHAIPFVVRLAARDAGSALLVKTSDLTWVAYNKYGGFNLYEGPQEGPEPARQKSFARRSTVASYNRPWHNRLSFPRGQQQNFVLHTEYPLVYWLEQQGYDVSYASCRDVERMFGLDEAGRAVGGGYAKHQALVSSGHDEYWTARGRAVWTAARNVGKHLLFFSGNELFWRVAWEVGDAEYSSRAEYRHVRCRKQSLDSAVRVFAAPASASVSGGGAGVDSDRAWTGTFMDPRQPNATSTGDHGLLGSSLPQNELTGQLYLVNAYRNDALEVPSEFHRLRFWRNTGVSLAGAGTGTGAVSARGKRVKTHSKYAEDVPYRTSPGLLGYEWDAAVRDMHTPPGLLHLSRTEVTVHKQLMQDYGAGYVGSGRVHHALTLYRNQTSGALVFSTGTCQWAWALAPLHDYSFNLGHVPLDARLQQATANMLADMGVLPPSSAKEAAAEAQAQAQALDDRPPRSYISSTLRGTGLHNHTVVREKGKARSDVLIQGSAVDSGGGVVALVEVSIDGGVTWGAARGNKHWHFSAALHFPWEGDGDIRGCQAVESQGPRNLYDDFAPQMLGQCDADSGASRIYPTYPSNTSRAAMYVTYHNGSPRLNLDVCVGVEAGGEEVMAVLSRATDDSGWTERPGKAAYKIRIRC